MGRLDFDPYVDGQDYQITELKIGDAVIKGDKATVEVTFKNFDLAEDMTFTLVKENGRLEDRRRGQPQQGFSILAEGDHGGAAG